jgi:hypothetical protein
MLTATQISDLRAFLCRVVPRGPIEELKLSSILTALEDYGTRSSTQSNSGAETQPSL